MTCLAESFRCASECWLILLGCQINQLSSCPSPQSRFTRQPLWVVGPHSSWAWFLQSLAASSHWWHIPTWNSTTWTNQGVVRRFGSLLELYRVFSCLWRSRWRHRRKFHNSWIFESDRLVKTSRFKITLPCFVKTWWAKILVRKSRTPRHLVTTIGM